MVDKRNDGLNSKKVYKAEEQKNEYMMKILKQRSEYLHYKLVTS
jgi:hypothetical protein